MAEQKSQMVEFEVVDKTLKGATQVSRDLWGPFDVKNDRFFVPLEAVDSFNVPGSGFHIKNQKEVNRLIAERLENTPFPFAPAQTAEGTAIIMNLPKEENPKKEDAARAGENVIEGDR